MDYPKTRTISGIPVYFIQSPIGKEIDGFRKNMDDINNMTRGYSQRLSSSGWTRNEIGFVDTGINPEFIKSVKKTLNTFKQTTLCDKTPDFIIIQNYGYGIYTKDGE